MMPRLRKLLLVCFAGLLFSHPSLAADFSVTGFKLDMTYSDVKAKLGANYQSREITVQNIPAKALIAGDASAGIVYLFYFMQDRLVWIYFKQEYETGKGPNAQSMMDAVKAKYGDATTFGPFPANGGATYVYGPDDRLLLNGDNQSVSTVGTCMTPVDNTIPVPGTNQAALMPMMWRAACNKLIHTEVFAINGIVKNYMVKIANEAPAAKYLKEQGEEQQKAKEKAAEAAKSVKPNL